MSLQSQEGLKERVKEKVLGWQKEKKKKKKSKSEARRGKRNGPGIMEVFKSNPPPPVMKREEGGYSGI